ncbi:16S rRNA-processing protein RimM [Asticcacaulis sp. AC460]|uniref:ribosome maturation factor RimM n=1 Tax=Asticcacaulis sp. AC460 TaxID=1282360 RepID=UPI0003C3B5AE|nr:ribosome maturation factor RimM [Asticcacaulis sp. AC460]ESQ90759.1 16S rRNA-processing protein RimM [Asticcacaulis sp. AC460]
MTKPNLVLVAQVGAPHGVQGEFKLLSFMDDPLSVLEHSPLLDVAGKPALVLTKARAHKGALLVFAEQAPDRTAAEKLKGLKLYVDRADLPDTDEEEYYVTDLIGMDVVDTSGNAVGKVVNVDNFGAGDLLDVKPLEGVSFYVPFTLAHVPEVHPAEGRIVVDLTGL